jgi:glycosyltransferase involved in cell wall biosynthesis
MNDRSNPLVSVVIPSYNHGRFLGRALQSLLDQTYANWEVIVIDNHSTDNTDEVMATFTDSRISYLKIHNNGVIAVSRNAGIRAAKGVWVAFLDSDDWWTNDKLNICIDYMDDEVDFIYHDLEIIVDQQRTFRRKLIKSRQVKTPVLIDLLSRGNAIVNSSVVVRKNFLEKIGGINESKEMVAAEDYNTWLCIAQLTEHFFYLPHTLGYYLIHNKNASHKDMSVPVRFAVDKFMNLLNEQQKLKLEVNLSYTKGRFNYLKGNYSEAKEDLTVVIKFGQYMLYLKAVYMISVIYFRNKIFGECKN